jgi:TfoX/Sxy family transcriptional regulator of competence genes
MTERKFLCGPGFRQFPARARGAWQTSGMAYDEELAERIRELIESEPGVREMRMFGGLAFLIGGNMAVAAGSQGGLLLRVDPADTAALVEQPHASRFQMRGREMNGWLHIGRRAVTTDDQLERWVAHGIAYARSLPPK